MTGLPKIFWFPSYPERLRSNIHRLATVALGSFSLVFNRHPPEHYGNVAG
jgi:hypothetical protein